MTADTRTRPDRHWTAPRPMTDAELRRQRRRARRIADQRARRAALARDYDR